MENKVTTESQYPDFGTLLEWLRENNRRAKEDYERFREMMAERELQWEKYCAERKEREAQLEKESQKRELQWEKYCTERKEREAQWEKEQAERAKKYEEWEEDRAATRKAIREMRELFTTQWGRLVEALSRPAALALFKKEGVEVDRIYEGVHKAKDSGQDVMEIDVALCDTTVAVIVEVKSRCDNHDIDYFLSQMQHCKKWYPDFANKKLLVAVAAIDYVGGADVYARRNGLYVLQLSGEDTYSMMAPQNPKTF